MNSQTGPSGYTTMQIVLHWTIAALVIFQLVLGEDIKPAYRAFIRGTEPAAADLSNANLHVYVGLAVLMLAITAWLVARLGSEFMPTLNEGTLLYMPVTLPGLSVTKAAELLQMQAASSSPSPKWHRCSARRDAPTPRPIRRRSR